MKRKMTSEIKIKKGYLYQKGVVNGALDVALLLSNVTQFKGLLRITNTTFAIYVGAGLILFSIILQLIVGGLLIYQTLWERKTLVQIERSTTSDETASSDTETTKLEKKTKWVNTASTILVFVILVLNIVINGLELHQPLRHAQVSETAQKPVLVDIKDQPPKTETIQC